MTSIKVTCSHCGKIYLRELRRVNEAKKFRWKQYCSLGCQKIAKNIKITVRCGNPQCCKTIKRSSKEIPTSGMCFCSKSCSAIVNNSKFPKRKSVAKLEVFKTCKSCGKKFYDNKTRRYCSPACYSKRPIFSAEKIIEEIKAFNKQNGRIPVKREYHASRVARLWFGTWNKAIKAAGLKPNPVMFAKKHIAKDGHKCDSLSEKIIDD